MSERDIDEFFDWLENDTVEKGTTFALVIIGFIIGTVLGFALGTTSL